MNGDKRGNIFKILAIGAAASAAAAAGVAAARHHKKKKIQRMLISEQAQSRKRKAYFIGSGLENLAGALYLIRDGNFVGENIYIIEPSTIVGGEYYAAGNADTGYIIRSGAQIFKNASGNLMDLLASVPSLRAPDISVGEDIITYNDAHKNASRARLFGEEGIIQLASLGLGKAERKAFFSLITKKGDIENKTIEEYFAAVPEFFDTKLWAVLESDFKLSKKSAASCFSFALIQNLSELLHIETHDMITTPVFNMYESVILPIKAYLERCGVNFMVKCRLCDIEEESGRISALLLNDNGARKKIYLDNNDLCFISCGCTSDGTVCGDIDNPPPVPDEQADSIEVMNILANHFPETEGLVGFMSSPAVTATGELTVTLNSNLFMSLLENYTSTPLGADAFITIKDSPWVYSLDTSVQPRTWGKVFVLRAVSLAPYEPGRFVKKPMTESNGTEALYELVCALQMQKYWDEIAETVVNAVVCIQPYALAPTLPGEKAPIIPENCENLALTGRFCNVEGENVLSAEYAVKSARIAVYTLIRCMRKIKSAPGAGLSVYARVLRRINR